MSLTAGQRLLAVLSLGKGLATAKLKSSLLPHHRISLMVAEILDSKMLLHMRRPSFLLSLLKIIKLDLSGESILCYTVLRLKIRVRLFETASLR